MSRRRKQRMMRIGSGLVPLGSAAYSADYNARVRAAGLEDDDAEWNARDIDDRRLRLARQITMYSNEWTGCPEAICQRMRGCMAPRVHCTNVPQPSEAELDAAWPQTLVTVRRALAAAEAHHERERKAREPSNTQAAPFVPATRLRSPAHASSGSTPPQRRARSRKTATRS